MLTNRPDMACYINGAGMISPQRTYDNEAFLTDIASYDRNVLTCLLPNFKDYIHPFQLRRLSRMLCMGLAAATICLREAGIETPDAVIAATGYGFQEDMAKFLTEMLEQDEQQLTPSYFMQSTYNALAGLIALSVKCLGYNTTYAGKGFAFETALQDAMMLLREQEAQHILAGSFDEASPVQFREYARLGYFKKETISNLQLFDCQTPGTIQGEGVAFFTLSAVSAPHTWCRLKGIRTIHKPVDYRELSEALTTFLARHGLTPGAIDVVVNGASGDVIRDRWNTALLQDAFPNAAEVRFKHLCGEYATATSFALWLGAMILMQQAIPDAVQARPVHPCRKVKTVLICNHFLGKHYAFLLLDREANGFSCP